MSIFKYPTDAEFSFAKLDKLLDEEFPNGDTKDLMILMSDEHLFKFASLLYAINDLKVWVESIIHDEFGKTLGYEGIAVYHLDKTPYTSGVRRIEDKIKRYIKPYVKAISLYTKDIEGMPNV